MPSAALANSSVSLSFSLKGEIRAIADLETKTLKFPMAELGFRTSMPLAMLYFLSSRSVGVSSLLLKATPARVVLRDSPSGFL